VRSGEWSVSDCVALHAALRLHVHQRRGRFPECPDRVLSRKHQRVATLRASRLMLTVEMESQQVAAYVVSLNLAHPSARTRAKITRRDDQMFMTDRAKQLRRAGFLGSTAAHAGSEKEGYGGPAWVACVDFQMGGGRMGPRSTQAGFQGGGPFFSGRRVANMHCGDVREW